MSICPASLALDGFVSRLLDSLPPVHSQSGDRKRGQDHNGAPHKVRRRTSEVCSQGFPGKSFSVEGCSGGHGLDHGLHGYSCCLDVLRLKAKSTSWCWEFRCWVCFSLSRMCGSFCSDQHVAELDLLCSVWFLPSSLHVRSFITSPDPSSNPSK